MLEGPSHRAIRAAVKQQLKGIGDDPNVLTVAVGEKLREGVGTGRKSIKFYVTKKGDVPQDLQIPPVINLQNSGNHAIQTDVVELLDWPQLFGMQSGDVLQAFDGDQGICGMTFVKNGIAYAFTNAHVIRRLQSDGNTGPIDWFDPISGPRQDVAVPLFASAISFDYVNEEDAALIRLSSAAIADPHRVRYANVTLTDKDFIRPINGQYWYVAAGRINTCVQPEPVDIPAKVKVDGKIALYRGFWKLKLVRGVAQPGISGALLCRSQGNRHLACGLIFGGVQGQFVWAYPFSPLFDRVFSRLP